MDRESVRRIQVASRVLRYFNKVNADPITQSDTDALRALAETEQEKLMALDDLACIVIRRTIGPLTIEPLDLRFLLPPEKSKATSA
jgi:hypothetical protein